MAKLSEVATHLGLSLARVSQLKSAGIIPAALRGKHDLDTCRAEYLAHLRETAAGRQSKDGGGLDLVTERALLAREQRKKIERENAVAAGDYIQVIEFNRMATISIVITRSKLLGLPPKLAPYLVGIETAAKAQEIVKTEIYTVLNELAATDLAKYDHSNEFATRSIADLLYGDEETDERATP